MPDNRTETFEYINGEPFARFDGVPDSGGWVKAHRDVLRAARLDAAAKVIYLLLLDECGRTGQGTVQYSYGRIKLEVDISENTIRKKLFQLQEAGFLEVSGDDDRASGHTERWYTPTPPDEMSFYRRVKPSYVNNARLLEAGKIRIPGVQRDRRGKQSSNETGADTAGGLVTNSAESTEKLHSKEENTSDLLNTEKTETSGTAVATPPTSDHIDLDELREFLGEEMFALYLQEEKGTTPSQET